jgi:hypothetical protein
VSFAPGRGGDDITDTEEVAAMRWTRAAAVTVGLLIVGVAAWGGIVAYVGPTFDFDTGTTTSAWVWSQNHTTLNLAPAVLGIVGGVLIMLPVAWRLARLGAVLALIAGIWFMLGPTVEPLWHEAGASTSALDGSTGSVTRRVLEGVGYHYGVGAALVLLAALALVLPARPRPVVEETSGTGTVPEEDRPVREEDTSVPEEENTRVLRTESPTTESPTTKSPTSA